MKGTTVKYTPRIQVPEICKRLQLGARTVYAMLEAKIIPALRLRRRWLIGRQTYDEWEKTFGSSHTNAIHYRHDEKLSN